MLGQEQIAKLLLPVGGLRKDEVREVARRTGLDVAEKPDSVEICFVPGNDYRAFVSERVEPRPGQLRDAEGAVLARHEGVAGFTVGQRKGLGIALGEPRYVTAIDAVANVVTVGEEDDLYADHAAVEAVTWVAGAPPPPGEPIEAKARYKAEAAPATLAEADRRPRHRPLRPPPARPHPRPGHRLLPRRRGAGRRHHRPRLAGLRRPGGEAMAAGGAHGGGRAPLRGAGHDDRAVRRHDPVPDRPLAERRRPHRRRPEHPRRGRTLGATSGPSPSSSPAATAPAATATAISSRLASSYASGSKPRTRGGTSSARVAKEDSGTTSATSPSSRPPWPKADATASPTSP